MAETRGPIKSAKRAGDNGHPCLVPQFKLNELDICPLVITDAVEVLYNILKWVFK